MKKILLPILLFACCCTFSLASPVRSVLGAKEGVVSDAADGWENPYVTDGLIAMWDGEWNVGGGLHNANASVWCDLSGNGNDAFRSGNAPFGLDYAWFDGATCYQTETDIDLAAGATLEVVGEFDSTATAPAQSDFIFWGKNERNLAGLSFHDVNSSSLCLIRGYIRTPEGNKYPGWDYHTTPDMMLEWGSLTWTFDGNLAGALYRNAVVKGSFNLNSTIVVPSNKIIILGAETPFVSPGNFLYGAVNCIRIYNRRLAPEEVAHNYAVDAERFGL